MNAAELVNLAERLQSGMNSQPLTPMRVIDAGDLQTAINALRRSRESAIEECAKHLEKIGARYHDGRDLVEMLRLLKLQPI